MRFPVPALAGLLALVPTAPPVRAQAIAIVNANVVDVRRGTVRPRSTVVVRDGRIASIGPADSTTLPPGIRQVDAAGGFLIPGLADMHAHFSRTEDLTVFLANGVTTVQYLNASSEELDWRDSIHAGRVWGPEIHACAGPLLDLGTPADGRRAVAQADSDGFRCVKPYDRISDSAFRALTDEARKRGIRTVGHIPRNLTWEQVLAARPSAIAHAEEFLYSPVTSNAAVDSIVTAMHDDHIALVATLVDYDLITRQVVELPELMRDPALAYYSPVHQRFWGSRNRYSSFSLSRVPDLRRRLDFQRSLVHMLDSAGAVVLVGTDNGNSLVLPGSTVHDELLQLVLSGLTPARALRAATLSPAEFLGVDGESGTVEAGRRADLVLLFGNPLRDITVTRLIAGVMRNGIWFPRDSLRSRLEEIRHRFAAERRFLDDVTRLGVRVALAGAARRSYVPEQRALNELAYQYWRVLDDTADARRTFAANVRLHPGSWMAHGSYGEWLEAAGDRPAALREVRAALAGHPRDRELRAMRDRLESASPNRGR
jgi:Amidohydrolase family